MTAEGFRPYPTRQELAALLRGEPVRLREPETGSLGPLPALLVAKWCPFTMPAGAFWKEAADVAGIELRLLDPESAEGTKVMEAARVAGVPCLIAAPDRLYYGLAYSLEEARAILEGGGP